jgi:hypothetical protein
MKRTTVISVRGRNHAVLLADPGFVYVGRAVRWTQWEASIWGNPFIAGEYEGDNAAERYRRYVLSRPELMRRLGELRGKTLGCWCGSYPENLYLGCHAVVLAELADNVGAAS